MRFFAFASLLNRRVPFKLVFLFSSSWLLLNQFSIRFLFVKTGLKCDFIFSGYSYFILNQLITKSFLFMFKIFSYHPRSVVRRLIKFIKYYFIIFFSKNNLFHLHLIIITAIYFLCFYFCLIYKAKILSYSY